MSDSSNSAPSIRTADLWAYMPCKDAHGPKLRLYITARNEIAWEYFVIYEEKPTLRPEDKGVLLHVEIDADTPRLELKEAVRQAAFKKIQSFIQREKDRIDGVDKVPKKE